jgi:hypothetical protein
LVRFRRVDLGKAHLDRLPWPCARHIASSVQLASSVMQISSGGVINSLDRPTVRRLPGQPI